MHCNPILAMKAEQDRLSQLAQKRKAIARLVQMNDGFAPVAQDVLLSKALELLEIVNAGLANDLRRDLESACNER